MSASSLPRLDAFIVVKGRQLRRAGEVLADCFREIGSAHHRMQGQYPRFVYGMKTGDGALIKIGIATEPERRLAELNQSGLRIAWTVLGDHQLEHALHALLFSCHHDREWFRLEGLVGDLDRALAGQLQHLQRRM